MPLDETLGCVAAESVLATSPVPPFVNSSMDGYALRATDTDGVGVDGRVVRLEVIGTVMAGAPLDVSVVRGNRPAS